MLPIDIGSLIDALGPVLVFAIVLIKLGLDFMSKRRERINGKDPKEVTREQINDVWGLLFDMDVLGRKQLRIHPCKCTKELE